MDIADCRLVVMVDHLRGFPTANKKRRKKRRKTILNVVISFEGAEMVAVYTSKSYDTEAASLFMRNDDSYLKSWFGTAPDGDLLRRWLL